ncbi:MAG: NUDIX hydrolase [Candidatus Levybacteria bacterium]|nr:NUDIX hydrolase [Candidatus Levybacteria bacterium]
MIRKAAGCIILRNNSILLLHRIDKDWWEVPGGKSEEGETLEQAAIREIKEELACDVRIVRKLGSTFFRAVNFELDYTWFLAEIKSGQIPKIGVPEEYDLFDYLQLNKLKTYNLSSSARNLLMEIEKGNIALFGK